MPSTGLFDSVTSFIVEPTKQIVVGSVLAGIVWKVFYKAEEKLNDDTKLAIAVWLLGVRLTPTTKDRRSLWLNLFWAVCGKPSSTKRMAVWCGLFLANVLATGLSTANR